MKTLTIACFLTALLHTAPQSGIHAQDFSEKGRPMNRVPFLRPGLKEQPPHGFSERTYLKDREYWLPRTNPEDFFDNFPGKKTSLLSSLRSPGKASLGKVQKNLSNGIQEAWVRHYASGMAPSYNDAAAIAVDGSGNVYVTGTSSKLPFGVDYLTVKYDATSNQVWVARYDGPGNTDDIATALAVDRSGNVYVTGGSGGDYATVKYNTSGVEEWEARYDGIGNSGDAATALAVDKSGNVYVTGGSGGDYATVKYNSSGVEEWVARYDGIGNSDNAATALAIDGLGNVYVTGRSWDSGTYDYATIKYDSAGALQWVARHSGTGGVWNEPRAIAVDKLSNVYVTGKSDCGMGRSYDYATLKYNSAGIQQWVAWYNGPAYYPYDEATALAVDGQANVYVTGRSSGSETYDDYATVKYDSNGVERWVARYNGPLNGWEGANAIAVDGMGNVYVTGTSLGSDSSYDYATLKYDSAGIQQWVTWYNGPGNSLDEATALAVDDSANVFIAGNSGSYPYFGCATIKYNSAGVEQWVARHDGQGNSVDVPTAMALDILGNIYVTGHSLGLGTGYDFVTVKYNSEGVEQWISRYDAPGNRDDWANAIAVDHSGNVYVTGRSASSNTYPFNDDYLTVKYNSSGIQQWVARYNGPGDANDYATAIAVDASGNVYVTGSSASSSGYPPNYACATIKYNSAGVQQWVARLIAPDTLNYLAAAIAVDCSGNVCVTGSAYGNSDVGPFKNEYVTVKYDGSGNQFWFAKYHEPRGSWAMATALATDCFGNVYVTGEMSNDYTTVKYDASGVQQWITHYDGPAHAVDYAWAIAIDGLGNVYVTGTSYGGSQTSDDYATVKYNSSGVQQWVARYNRAGNTAEYARSVAVDGSGNVYVTGYSYSYASGDYDYVTVKYNSTGVEQWIACYNGQGNSRDEAYALAIDGLGNVYVTGESSGTGWSIYTTIKYIQTPVPSVIPNAYKLEQNYPNPFNLSTTIRYSLPQAGYVTLKMFNVLGQQVATLANGEQSAGDYEVQWNAMNLPSGVYFCRFSVASYLRVGEFTETKKLVLIK